MCKTCKCDDRECVECKKNFCPRCGGGCECAPPEEY